jgi:hypothetical protein
VLSRLSPPNIGHTLMDVGVRNVLRRALAGYEYEIRHVEQIFPLQSLYAWWHPARWVDALPHWPPRRAWLGDRLKAVIAGERVSNWLWRTTAAWVNDVSLAVACGGPGLIPEMGAAPAVDLAFSHLHGAFTCRGIPVLSLSMGSCFPYREPPDIIADRRDRRCAERYLRTATTTTARDAVAQRLFTSLGFDCPLVPCPVLLFHDGPVEAGARDTIVINYMERWPLAEAHRRRQLHPDLGPWRHSIRHVIRAMQGRYRIVFACHNREEVALARGLTPEPEIVEPTTADDYLALGRRAVAGVACRIHAAIPLASMGAASIVIGSDTRVATCEAIGLPTAYVEDVRPDWLQARLERLVQAQRQEAERLSRLKEQAFSQYVALTHDLLARRGIRNGQGMFKAHEASVTMTAP